MYEIEIEAEATGSERERGKNRKISFGIQKQLALKKRNFQTISNTMDACEAVEKELQRVISKFTGVNEHAKRMLGDVVKNFEDLKSSIAEGKLQKTTTTTKPKPKTISKDIISVSYVCMCLSVRVSECLY